MDFSKNHSLNHSYYINFYSSAYSLAQLAIKDIKKTIINKSYVLGNAHINLLHCRGEKIIEQKYHMLCECANDINS